MPTPEKDKATEIQKVKLADEDVAGIISIIETEDGKTAIGEYTTTYKDASPFARLVNVDFKASKKHTAYLSLYNGLWHIEKRPDRNYIK